MSGQRLSRGSTWLLAPCSDPHDLPHPPRLWCVCFPTRTMWIIMVPTSQSCAKCSQRTAQPSVITTRCPRKVETTTLTLHLRVRRHSLTQWLKTFKTLALPLLNLLLRAALQSPLLNGEKRVVGRPQNSGRLSPCPGPGSHQVPERVQGSLLVSTERGGQSPWMSL